MRSINPGREWGCHHGSSWVRRSVPRRSRCSSWAPSSWARCRCSSAGRNGGLVNRARSVSRSARVAGQLQPRGRAVARAAATVGGEVGVDSEVQLVRLLPALAARASAAVRASRDAAAPAGSSARTRSVRAASSASTSPVGDRGLDAPPQPSGLGCGVTDDEPDPALYLVAGLPGERRGLRIADLLEHGDRLPGGFGGLLRAVALALRGGQP